MKVPDAAEKPVASPSETVDCTFEIVIQFQMEFVEKVTAAPEAW